MCQLPPDSFIGWVKREVFNCCEDLQEKAAGMSATVVPTAVEELIQPNRDEGRWGYGGGENKDEVSPSFLIYTLDWCLCSESSGYLGLAT